MIGAVAEEGVVLEEQEEIMMVPRGREAVVSFSINLYSSHLYLTSPGVKAPLASAWHTYFNFFPCHSPFQTPLQA